MEQETLEARDESHRITLWSRRPQQLGPVLSSPRTWYRTCQLHCCSKKAQPCSWTARCSAGCLAASPTPNLISDAGLISETKTAPSDLHVQMLRPRQDWQEVPQDGVSRTRKSDASFQALHTWIEANARRKHGEPTQVGGQTKRQAARCHRDLALM